MLGILNILKGFVLGCAVTVAAVLWFEYTHYLIRSDDGFRAVAKIQLGFERLYVDVRGWGAIDYLKNRDVVKAMAAAGVNKAQQEMSDAVDKLKAKAQETEKELQDRLKPKKTEDSSQ